MMGWHKKYAEVIAVASSYLAVGQTEIYLDDDDPDLPWAEVRKIEAGTGYRLNGPSGCYFVAEQHGLMLKWLIDFETRDANGMSTHLFDRDRLRRVMQKLQPKARKMFGDFLAVEVMPAVEKVTSEWREYLNKQLDSEDCLRGLISYALLKDPPHASR